MNWRQGLTKCLQAVVVLSIVGVLAISNTHKEQVKYFECEGRNVHLVGGVKQLPGPQDN